MSPVDFKKWPCHPVEFKGQGPQYKSEGWVGLCKAPLIGE